MATSAVIRLAALDSKRAVDLFEQHHASELVREGHRAQREALICPREHMRALGNRAQDVSALLGTCAVGDRLLLKQMA